MRNTKRTADVLAVATLVFLIAIVGTGAVTGAAAQDATVSPGESVQDAVNNANDDDTIAVEAGTYDESVTLNVTGLTLEGPNAGTPGYSTTRGDEAKITRGATVAAEGVTLDGVQIENNDTNGVRLGPDTVPDNTTIRNSIVTNVTGGTFLRGGSDAGAGNGIQVQFNEGPPAGETAGNLRILDNEISNISTPDVSDRTTAVGINVLPRGNDVEVEIDGNTITDIEPGASGSSNERARGVSIDTQVNDTTDTGRVNGATITNNDITGLRSSDRYRAIGLFEDGSLSPPEGPRNFLIEKNEFDDFNASGVVQASIFVGGYETLGNDHEVTSNNIDDGFVERFTGGASGFDTLDAVGNWWGDETGPSGADTRFNTPGATGDGVPVSRNVSFDPFLESPFDEETDEPTETTSRRTLSRGEVGDAPPTEDEARRSTGRGESEGARGGGTDRRDRSRGERRSR